jgi:hypothetical protein
MLILFTFQLSMDRIIIVFINKNVWHLFAQKDIKNVAAHLLFKKM